MGGRFAALGALVLLTACGPQAASDAGPRLDAGPMLGGDAGPDASTLFEETVEPLLVTHCSSCHEGAGSPGPMYLELGNYEQSVLAYPGLVVPGDPDNSLILTKGEHRGPMWSLEDAATIRAWILAL